MRSKQLLFILIALSGLAACRSSDRKFTIIGSITGLPEQTVILEQLNANDIITIVDSQHAKSDGHFEISGMAPEPGLYRLHFHPNKYILLSVDKGTIKINSNWASLETYTVTGSAESENLKNFLGAIREYRCDVSTMFTVLDTLKARGNDSVMAVAKRDFQDMNQHFTNYVERFCDSVPYEPNAIFAARMLNPATEGAFISAFTQGLNRKFPNTRMTTDFTEFYQKINQKPNQQATATAATGTTTEMAPEVALPDVNGKVVALSSFKGKYVLLDFWASWCSPCRRDNPHVLSAYKKFKDKNFTIFAVSLDDNKDDWKKAIKEDGLEWTQVSDLKKWNSSAAATYSINSIPSNFLIDPTGKIIARNLHGEKLEAKLTEVLNAPAQAAIQ